MGASINDHRRPGGANVALDAASAGFLSHLSTGSVSLFNCSVKGVGIAETQHRAYTLNARYNKLINCRCDDIYGGVFSNGTAVLDVYIENFMAKDCSYIISGNADAPIPSLRVNGIHVKNTVATTGYIFYFSLNSVGYWEINNISAHNLQGGIYLSTYSGNTFPSLLHINGFKHINDANGNAASIVLNNSSIVDIIIDNYESEKANQMLSASVNATGLKTVKFNKGFVDSVVNVKMNEIGTAIDNFTFDGVYFKNPVTAASKLLYAAEGLTTFGIVNCRAEGANMDYLTDVVTGKTFTNFLHQGNEFISLTGAHKTQTPTNTVTSGSIGL